LGRAFETMGGGRLFGHCSVKWGVYLGGGLFYLKGGSITDPCTRRSRHRANTPPSSNSSNSPPPRDESHIQPERPVTTPSYTLCQRGSIAFASPLYIFRLHGSMCVFAHTMLGVLVFGTRVYICGFCCKLHFSPDIVLSNNHLKSFPSFHL